MAKRKYARSGDTAVAYECTKRICKWQGLPDERKWRRTEGIINSKELVCPKCGNNTFYGLIEFPKKETV